MKNRKMVVVFGADGMLGHDVVHYFAGGFKVLCPRHSEVDITDRESVKRYFWRHGVGYDTIVINCAACTDVKGIQFDADKQRDSFSVNCLGAYNLASVCRETGTWLIHVSTDYVYSENAMYREFPKNIYGCHKFTGELLVVNSGLDYYTIVRVGCLYGMNRNKSFIHKFLENAKGKIAACDFRPQVVDFQRSVPTSTLFVCEAFRYIIEHEIFGVLDVSPKGSPVTRYEFANRIVSLANQSGKFDGMENVIPLRVEGGSDYLPSSSCMMEIDPSLYLDFSDIDWEQDLERFFK